MTGPEVYPTTPPPVRPVLVRSRDDRMIAGVCGGLGRYFGIDAVLVRIVFVVLALAGGSGLLAYLVAWVLVPEARPGDPAGPEQGASVGVAGSVVVGALLVVAGTALLLDQVFPGFRSVLGPLALIVVGLAVLLIARRR